CCRKFNAVRSALRIPPTPPVTCATAAPGSTSSPSSASARNVTPGSASRNVSRATSSPEITPCAWATNAPRALTPGPTALSVVMSPVPTSSESAYLTRLSATASSMVPPYGECQMTGLAGRSKSACMRLIMSVCVPAWKRVTSRLAVLVRHAERIVDGRQPLAGFVRRRGARRRHLQPVEVRERPHAARLAGSHQLDHGLGVGAAGIEGDERLPGLAIPHQLDRPEHAEAAHFPHARVLRRDPLKLRPDHVGAERARVLEALLFLEDADARHHRRACQGVPRVREASGEYAIAERLGDPPADDHAADRD